MSDEIKNNNNDQFIQLLKENGFAQSLLNSNVTVSMCLSSLFKLKKQILDEIEELRKEIKKVPIEIKKFPHKCPICIGSGLSPFKEYDKCPCCNGTSIVWG
jgi:predicted Zn-ribbon and HTH transcriptional regulator